MLWPTIIALISFAALLVEALPLPKFKGIWSKASRTRNKARKAWGGFLVGMAALVAAIVLAYVESTGASATSRQLEDLKDENLKLREVLKDKPSLSAEERAKIDGIDRQPIDLSSGTNSLDAIAKEMDRRSSVARYQAEEAAKVPRQKEFRDELFERWDRFLIKHITIPVGQKFETNYRPFPNTVEPIYWETDHWRIEASYLGGMSTFLTAWCLPRSLPGPGPMPPPDDRIAQFTVSLTSSIEVMAKGWVGYNKELRGPLREASKKERDAAIDEAFGILLARIVTACGAQATNSAVK